MSFKNARKRDFWTLYLDFQPSTPRPLPKLIIFPGLSVNQSQYLVRCRRCQNQFTVKMMSLNWKIVERMPKINIVQYTIGMRWYAYGGNFFEVYVRRQRNVLSYFVVDMSL